MNICIALIFAYVTSYLFIRHVFQYYIFYKNAYLHVPYILEGVVTTRSTTTSKSADVTGLFI